MMVLGDISAWSYLASHAAELAIAAVLLAWSAFFSGAETAMFNLSRGQVQRLRDTRAGGKRVALLLMRPRRLLNTLLLGNMLVNVTFAGIAARLVLGMKEFGAPAWVLAAGSIAPLLVLILAGEVAPKSLAFLIAERWSIMSAPVVQALEWVFVLPLTVLERVLVHPAMRILAPHAKARAAITSRELGAVLELSAKRGIIDRNVNALLQEIVELTVIRVKDIMVPRVDVIAYDVNAPADGLRAMFSRTHLRRVPAYDGSLDRVIGVIHAKRLLLNPDKPLRELVVPVPFVPETANVERVLLQLRVKRAQVAVVVDEYGGTAGLITMQDILEEIVGEIPDQRSEPGPAVTELDDGAYVIDADLPIHEWAEAFGIDLPSRRISTVGGFVTALLGQIPHQGDEATYGNLRFTVAMMRKRRIGLLKVNLLNQPGEKDDA